MKTVRTTCAYCGVGCGIVAEHLGGRTISVTGDAEHPANRGSLCSKGTHLGETVGLEGRLLQPMIGQEETGWNRALDEVAGRLRNAIDRHGPDSVGFYVSGQLLTEDYYAVNKLAKGFVGTANIDTNSRLCMASAVAAHNRAFGEDVVPCTYGDLDCADLILLVGSNTAWCHPVIWQQIERTRERRGTKLVVIDPRRTETAERADLHIPIAPDGDVALFNALLGELAARGALDTQFLAQRCTVPDGFFETLGRAEHGIDAELFRRLADLAIAHPRMVTLFSQGVNQSACGTDKGNAIINLHLATGRINRLGAGPFSITGQPNAMGGREVGGLASTLACHLGFSAAEREAVGRFWKTDRLCTGPGLKAVDMFRAVHEGSIKFLWIMATNPAVSMSDARFVQEALARCETLVVSDIMADTDTARFAHIRLPALGWGEKDGTVTNSERVISRQRAILPPPGAARADWQIVADVAKRLGHSERFAWTTPAQVFGEYAAMTQLAAERGKALDLTALAGIDEQEYQDMAPLRWGGERPLAAGFAHPDGKARIVAVNSPQQKARDPRYPLILNTGRYRDHWHTMTRTGLSPRLSIHRREPLAEMHPSDAATLGVDSGELVRLVSAQGEAVFRADIRDTQRPGEIFVPMHFTALTASASRTGVLPSDMRDPHSGQPAFKRVAIAAHALHPDWRAFLLRREAMDAPETLYWSRARIADGWLYELAGTDTADIAAWLPPGARSEVADLARGMRRIAVADDTGAVTALLYITRSGRLPARDWVERQFALPSTSITELLAGRPQVAQPDRGKLVCVCHDVGERAVALAIAEGADSVAAVGKATCAGTNCGSCRPIIARLIADHDPIMQEAAE